MALWMPWRMAVKGFTPGFIFVSSSSTLFEPDAEFGAIPELLANGVVVVVVRVFRGVTVSTGGVLIPLLMSLTMESVFTGSSVLLGWV